MVNIIDAATNPLIKINYIYKIQSGKMEKRKKQNNTLVAQDCKYSSHVGVKYAASFHAILLE